MANQPRNLAGQTVAITGAARGIGRATAQALVAQGMKVAIGDIDRAAAQRTAEELGGGTLALAVDVTDAASFSAFLDEVEQRLGTLDVLVNNAGIMQLGRFLQEDDLTARRMIDINLHGVITGSRLALARMVPRNSGHVVNIASQAGKMGFAGGATYSATKHAVIGLTEALVSEMRLLGSDVRLSYVMPAIVNTELGSGLVRNRGVKKLEPTDVADAIVGALRDGRVDVWVPRSVRPLSVLTALLPRRVTELVARGMKADRALYGADADVRAAYELRAARSEPGLMTAGEPVALEAQTGTSATPLGDPRHRV
jgi:NADP-dependent 3-hydroxy acid dehydrogenase YdfG